VKVGQGIRCEPLLVEPSHRSESKNERALSKVVSAIALVLIDDACSDEANEISVRLARR